MIYYMIRHKESGDYMPEMKRGKGYSFWNPSNGKLPGNTLASPRVFDTLRRARRVCSMWVTLPNARYKSYQSYDGDWDEFVDSKPDGRKIEDLEIVEVDIIEIQTIVSRIDK